ncbi:MAG: DUF1559 domain-containing protein [Mariniblastus sp.]
MKRRAFTLVELLVVIAIIGILIGMFLPATRQVREASRRATCMNNIRQIALAMHNYESAHEEFPSAMGDHRLVEAASHSDAKRLSGMLCILPFIEQNLLSDQISNPATFEGVNFPAYPGPWEVKYEPWRTQLPILVCPTSSQSKTEFGQMSYAFSIGDTARGIHNQQRLRGAFGVGLNATFGDFKDGTTNTILMIEMGTNGSNYANSNFAVGQPASILDNPRQCLTLLDPSDADQFDEAVRLGSPARGGCWADGAAGCSLVNTILPPNSPSCSITGNQVGDGIYSAGSSHPGVAIIALADGSSHSIKFDVDTGIPNATLTKSEMLEEVTPSPFGVYGALGTLASEEESSIDDL